MGNPIDPGRLNPPWWFVVLMIPVVIVCVVWQMIGDAIRALFGG